MAVVRCAGGIADHTFATDALFAGCRGRDAGLSQSLGNRHAKRHGDARTATGQYNLETIRSRPLGRPAIRLDNNLSYRLSMLNFMMVKATARIYTSKKIGRAHV